LIASASALSNSSGVAFFGAVENFNFWQIGGVESYLRRLAFQLAEAGKIVDFVQYGSDTDLVERPFPGISIHRYVLFDKALEHLAQHASIVLVSSTHRKDRLNFIKFRKANDDKIIFYFVASYWSDSWVRRKCYFLESSIYPYNGGVLCMSPRLLKASGKLKAELLLPPVPEEYFVEPENKTPNGKITVTYIGRTVYSKGVDEAIKIFKQLQGESRIQTQVCGYASNDTREDNSIHEWLTAQSDIKYICENNKQWSPSIDEKIIRILKETDILILPYKSLYATIDMPLLLLEGMAGNCCIITTPIGDIPNIYGESSFILPIKDFIPAAVALIKQAQQSTEVLEKERRRIANQLMNLVFDSQSASKKLLSLLSKTRHTSQGSRNILHRILT
jgi:glycosyltransferase involved in cell wall biosynthesis